MSTGGAVSGELFDAAGWLAQRMQGIRGHDTCAVVWHGFFRGYLNPRGQNEIEDVLLP
ncbi:hypothetical protein [Lentzea jiangxiensis]|uniref:Uncharacterized protein n=1 Tax=Lentzea jiangxiensis TaxID=641025 RepID=A0A1H0SKI3_9PSEU|nr:hypothetical protein [Lentzea jiangxiensis]SDP42281.1 hypothetical protein SAMN05421507_108126 [Lentzea jiangxiensis]